MIVLVKLGLNPCHQQRSMDLKLETGHGHTHVRLEAASSHSDGLAEVSQTNVQEIIQLSPVQIRDLCDARGTLNAGLAAIAEQRLANIDALRGQRPECSASEVELADYQIEHHRVCQQSRMLSAEEDDLFCNFNDAVYQVRPSPSTSRPMSNGHASARAFT